MKNKSLLLVILAVVILAGIYFLVSQKGEERFSGAPAVQTEPAIAGIELKRPLVVGLVSWPGYAGGIVANNGFAENRESTFYKKYGLLVKFVLIEDIDARGKAFVKGGPDGVDVVWSTVDFWSNEAPAYVESGTSVKAFMQVDWSRGGDALVVNRDVKAVEDLRGKKIALVQYTPSHWLLESLLAGSKLTVEDKDAIRKNLIFSQDTMSARAAFTAGQADATVVWEPDVSIALAREGSYILKSTKDYPNIIADVMVAKDDFLKTNPRTIEAFIRGFFDGVAQAEAQPEKAARLLMENESLFAELGLEKTVQSLSWVKWTGMEDNIKMFGLNGQPPLFDSVFTGSAQSWKALGLIKEVLDPASVKDDSYLRNVYAAQ
ncbi:ABC transporter substrate-binding protein [Candidatus Uhrbacteria bacterium]|nr:ABC transporter substrate-binding protein [Candidatus Uhrbacteria bacterium]